MTTANKITLTRIAMIPFFIYFAAQPMLNVEEYKVGIFSFPTCTLIALILFCVASFTDFLDGYVARKYNQVTDFGKFVDPLADKLLVCSAMICLVEMGRIPAWIVIVIISREFIISGFRLIASDNGRVIAANYWGKFKTTFQMVMICLMIANIEALSVLTTIVMWVALVLTVVSLVDYLMKNKEKETKP